MHVVDRAKGRVVDDGGRARAVPLSQERHAGDVLGPPRVGLEPPAQGCRLDRVVRFKGRLLDTTSPASAVARAESQTRTEREERTRQLASSPTTSFHSLHTSWHVPSACGGSCAKTWARTSSGRYEMGDELRHRQVGAGVSLRV